MWQLHELRDREMALFIGGPKHGEIEVCPYDKWMEEEWEDIHFYSGGDVATRINTRRYIWRELKFSVYGQRIRVMALEHLTPEQVLDNLKTEFKLSADNDYRTITNKMPAWATEGTGKEFI